MMIAPLSLLKSLPRLASMAPFLCLIVGQAGLLQPVVTVAEVVRDARVGTAVLQLERLLQPGPRLLEPASAKEDPAEAIEVRGVLDDGLTRDLAAGALLLAVELDRASDE